MQIIRIAGLLLLAQVALAAASVDAGRRMFEANCVVCHGMPADVQAQKGANNPAFIRSTINTRPDMRHLASITDADLANIAVYLAKPDTTDADRIFDWGQAAFPALLPGKPASASAQGYYYRFYPATSSYVAVKDGRLLYLDTRSMKDIADLGTASSFLDTAEKAGF